MVSFLVSIDPLGNIRKVWWGEPVYIIPNLYQSLLSVFADVDKGILLNVFAKCVREQHFECEMSLLLKTCSARIKICVMPMQEDILVFGVDEKLSREIEFPEDFRDLVGRFMSHIAGYDSSGIQGIRERTRLEYEKIQMLNNELINTRRSLEKANLQLNVLNKELNNRLVKDALTGLVSRYQYRAEIEMMIAENPDKLGIFTFIDVDSFKKINDTYGHAAGDVFLVGLANRLKSMTLGKTIKMRIAGDEFGLYTHGFECAGVVEFEQIWDQLTKHVLTTPVEIQENVHLPISLSAGMAVYGLHTHNVYDLIEYADFAMFLAKKQGKNRYAGFDDQAYAKAFADRKNAVK